MLLTYITYLWRLIYLSPSTISHTYLGIVCYVVPVQKYWSLPWDCTGFIEYSSMLLLWTSELSVCIFVISSVTWKCSTAVLRANQMLWNVYWPRAPPFFFSLPGCWGCPELSVAPPSHPSSACGCCVQTPAKTVVTGLHTHKHTLSNTDTGNHNSVLRSGRDVTTDGVFLITEKLDSDVTRDGAGVLTLDLPRRFLGFDRSIWEILAEDFWMVQMCTVSLVL